MIIFEDGQKKELSKEQCKIIVGMIELILKKLKNDGFQSTLTVMRTLTFFKSTLSICENDNPPKISQKDIKNLILKGVFHFYSQAVESLQSTNKINVVKSITNDICSDTDMEQLLISRMNNTDDLW